MKKKTILFVCDGRKAECSGSPNCYKNGGYCKYTENIENAMHFKKNEDTDAFMEILPESKQEAWWPEDIAVSIEEADKNRLDMYVRNTKILAEQLKVVELCRDVISRVTVESEVIRDMKNNRKSNVTTDIEEAAALIATEIAKTMQERINGKKTKKKK